MSENKNSEIKSLKLQMPNIVPYKICNSLFIFINEIVFIYSIKTLLFHVLNISKSFPMFFQWIQVSICWFAMNCLVLIGEINDNKYNEYNYNSAAIKFQCIFAWLLFQCSIRDFLSTCKNSGHILLIFCMRT